jgi:hypothetical protein
MRENLRGTCWVFALLFFGAGIASSQVQRQSQTTLVVNGRTGPVPVVEVDGHSYIDLEALAKITNGQLSFQQSRIVLTIPASTTSDSVPAIPPKPVDESAMSRDFMRAGIEEVTETREWATTLAYAIQNGSPVTEDWMAVYREHASSSLSLATVAASTDADRNALQLLNNQFDAVRQWSSNLLKERQSLDTGKYAVSPNALQEEPLSQKIVACGHFLSSMLASGTYQDDASCH